MAATAKKPKTAPKNKPKTSRAKTVAKQTKNWRPIAAIGLAVIIIAVAIWLLTFTNKATAIDACMPENLTLSAGEQNPAAGTVYQHMMITNKGDKDCTVGGYPTAFLYGMDGFAAGSSAAALPQPAPHVITLQKGKSAFTILGYPQPSNFNPGICSGNSTSLQLYIPGATTALTLPLQMAWCPGFSSTALQAQN